MSESLLSAAAARPRVRVYLSSTYQDLVEFRRTVDTALSKLGYEVVGMEGYVASDARPVDKCLADVRACEVYVGLFAWRYGFVPPGHERSITELEYREATRAGKERLIFLARDGADWPGDQVEQAAAAAVERLREQLKVDHVVAFFTTPDNLAVEVVTAITAGAERRLLAGVATLRSQQAEADQDRRRERQRVVNLLPVEATRFVDRVDQRQELGAYLGDRSLRMVKVVGRGGMGKSALVSCVMGELETCVQETAPGDSPDVPDGLVYLSARSTGLSLERLQSDALKLLGDEDAGRLAQAWTSRDATVEQKVETLLGALRSGRYVVLLDALDVVLDGDLAIAEAGLRAFVEACLRRSGAPLLVVTSRMDVLVPPEALAAVRVVKVEHGLEPHDASSLLRHLDPQGELGLRDAAPDQLDRVANLTGGIPRALEVLAGILQRDPAATLDQLLQDEGALGARTVEDLVAEGYRRLEDDDRRVMQALAVLGGPAPPTAVAFVLHPWFPGLDVNACLRCLIAAYFVTASRRTGEFWLQALDREHAYHEIPEEAGGAEPAGYTRTALELRAADFYASIRKPADQWLSLEDVAPQLAEFEHCVRAGAFDRALEVLQPIDEHHLALWGHYLRLIGLRTAVLDEPVRPDLRAANLAGLGAYSQVLGRYDEAVRYYEEAVRLAHDEGHLDAEIDYVGNLGRVHRNLGDLDQAIACLGRTLEHHERKGDRRGTAVWSDRLGLAYWNVGLLAGAVELGERAVAIAQEVGDGRTEAAALSNLALVFQTDGRLDRARAVLAESVVIAQRVGDRRGEAIALGRQGAAALAAGDPAAALDLHERALAIADALGERREQSYQLLGVGRALAARGDLGDAVGRLRAATDLGVSETAPVAGLRLGIVLLRLADRPAAAAAFDAAVHRCRERLARCDRLYGTRYALGTALAGAAVTGSGWDDGSRRPALLAPAVEQYRMAVAVCPGTGVVDAVLGDLAELGGAVIDGLEDVVGVLRAARADP